MNKQIIIPDRLRSLHESWHFSPGILIDNALYISGTIGVLPDGTIPPNPEDQYVACFENMKSVLDEVGATFANLTEMTSYHVYVQHSLAGFFEVRDRYVVDPYPTWTALGVRELSNKDLVVEIKGLAHI